MCEIIIKKTLKCYRGTQNRYEQKKKHPMSLHRMTQHHKDVNSPQENVCTFNIIPTKYTEKGYYELNEVFYNWNWRWHQNEKGERPEKWE